MFLTGFSDEIITSLSEKKYITYLQRPETTYTRYKETGAILFFLWFEGVWECIQGSFWALRYFVRFVFYNGIQQSLLVYRFQYIVDAVYGTYGQHTGRRQ